MSETKQPQQAEDREEGAVPPTPPTQQAPATPGPTKHVSAKSVKYEDVLLRVRKSNVHIILNSYLALLYQNIENASKEFALRGSLHLSKKDADSALYYLEQYVFFLNEAQDLFKGLIESIEELIIAEKSTFAKLTVKAGEPYNSKELNKMIKESQSTLRDDKEKLKDRKESKLKAASKKKSTKKASKKK